MNNFEISKKEEYNSNLQFSLFKPFNNQQNNLENSNFVEDFELSKDENVATTFSKDFNEYNDKQFKPSLHHYNSKSIKKCENNLNVPNSTSDYLCSGYFGQKNENNVDSNVNCATKPFPMAEDCKRSTIYEDCNREELFNDHLVPNFGDNKPRNKDDTFSNFNGSFFSTASITKSTNMNNLMNQSNSSNSNTFTDLVRNVSLSCLNKKKKSISFFNV